ncbi:hypothetical protein TNCV_4339641 [Trichonephila clavipes]|nr:hypothetical protein TNCV_4339641 [Trichonephila clavipes]
MQCSTCGTLGHTRNHCSNTQACFSCSSTDDHDRTSCEPRCINCTNHNDLPPIPLVFNDCSPPSCLSPSEVEVVFRKLRGGSQFGFLGENRSCIEAVDKLVHHIKNTRVNKHTASTFIDIKSAFDNVDWSTLFHIFSFIYRIPLHFQKFIHSYLTNRLNSKLSELNLSIATAKTVSVVFRCPFIQGRGFRGEHDLQEESPFLKLVPIPSISLSHTNTWVSTLTIAYLGLPI